MTDSIWDALNSDADPEVIKTVIEVEDRRRRDRWIRESLQELPIQELARALVVGVNQQQQESPRGEEDSVVLAREEYENLLSEMKDEKLQEEERTEEDKPKDFKMEDVLPDDAEIVVDGEPASEEEKSESETQAESASGGEEADGEPESGGEEPKTEAGVAQ